MKYTSAALGTLLGKVKESTIHAILLYGPDKGLISYIATEVIKISNKPSSTISYKDAQYKGFDITLNNISLFSGSEILKIYDTPPTIDSSLKKLLLHKMHNFPLLIADELAPSSSLRKFFETEEKLAVCGCYVEDEKTVAQFIKQFTIAQAKKITPDAIAYLSSTIGGDRLFTINELNKLLLFVHNKDTITLDDATKISGSNLMTSSDQLCIAFVKGDTKRYFSELSKLLAENISSVWIIRALMRYYINLYIVVSLKERGETLDVAMQHLKPPIFFKYVADFRLAAASAKVIDIMRVLRELEQAEIDCKSSGASGEKICELLFFRSRDLKR